MKRPVINDRRKFLRNLTAGIVLASSKRPARANDQPEEGDAYWDRVRAAFLFKEDKVPMNAANLCPSPAVVVHKQWTFTSTIETDCSLNNRQQFDDIRQRTRKKIAESFSVHPDTIALVRNTSEANNTIVNGFPLRAGDEVVIWNENHPTNNVAWAVSAQRRGFECRHISLPADIADVAQILDVFAATLSPRTRVLALTHMSNKRGLLLPIEELSALAHRHGIYVHIDGAQTWGARPIDLSKIQCDSFAASSHKWFMGPKEVGILYIKDAYWNHIWPSIVGNTWGDKAESAPVGARKFESFGQRNDSTMAALETASDFVSAIGIDRINQRIEDLAGYLKRGLQQMGVEMVTPAPTALSGGVCVVRVPIAKRQFVMDRLYREYGIAGSMSGGLRLCPHIYNTREHIDRALQGVRSVRDLIV